MNYQPPIRLHHHHQHCVCTTSDLKTSNTMRSPFARRDEPTGINKHETHHHKSYLLHVPAKSDNGKSLFPGDDVLMKKIDLLPSQKGNDPLTGGVQRFIGETRARRFNRCIWKTKINNRTLNCETESWATKGAQSSRCPGIRRVGCRRNQSTWNCRSPFCLC